MTYLFYYKIKSVHQKPEILGLIKLLGPYGQWLQIMVNFQFPTIISQHTLNLTHISAFGIVSSSSIWSKKRDEIWTKQQYEQKSV